MAKKKPWRFRLQNQIERFWFYPPDRCNECQQKQTIGVSFSIQDRICLYLFYLLTLPLTLLFCGASFIRRQAFHQGFLTSRHLDCPTIIVGGITVGGSGKTPLLIALANALKENGLHPGIISRGYGSGHTQCREVKPSDLAAEVGDEPLLIAQRTHCPVWIGASRFEAGQALLFAHPDCDIILSDDGLQHYRLRRDFEIVVFDERGIGNGFMLPAGPLREPVSRLQQVDFIALNNIKPAEFWQKMAKIITPANKETVLHPITLKADAFYHLGKPEISCLASDLQHKKLYAIAAIGNPQRFFNTLSQMGLKPICRSFPDHYRYQHGDLEFAADGVLLMTEKDAVKCTPLIGAQMPQEVWVLPVSATLPASLVPQILEIQDGCKTTRHSGMPDL